MYRIDTRGIIKAMNDLRSPIAKVKGLGSSGDASHHFWITRLTALALVPLVIWFCFSIASLPTVTHQVLVYWLDSPFNSTMTILLIIIGFHHGQLGIQVILEDYISTHKIRIPAIIITKFIAYFMMALGVYSIAKISFVM